MGFNLCYDEARKLVVIDIAGTGEPIESFQKLNDEYK